MTARAARSFDDARMLAARGELGEARSALEAILASEPGHVPALLLKGSVLLQQREEEEALRTFSRAAALQPHACEALNGLARCLHTLGRNEDALAVAEAAKDLLGKGDNFRETGPVYLTLVWCLRDMRRFKEALAVAEEGLARCADSVLAQWASVVEEELAEAQKEEC
jgi:tetratricopeptide (TPR) repeat protein